MSKERPPPTPAPGDGKCRPGWRAYGRFCYFVYDSQKGLSWAEAQHYCQLGSAQLASFHSRAEVEFIRQMNYTKYHHLWIGLTRDSACMCTHQDPKAPMPAGLHSIPHSHVHTHTHNYVCTHGHIIYDFVLASLIGHKNSMSILG